MHDCFLLLNDVFKLLLLYSQKIFESIFSPIKIFSTFLYRIQTIFIRTHLGHCCRVVWVHGIKSFTNVRLENVLASPFSGWYTRFWYLICIFLFHLFIFFIANLNNLILSTFNVFWNLSNFLSFLLYHVLVKLLGVVVLILRTKITKVIWVSVKFFLNSQKILLGVRPYLSSSSSPNIIFHFFPIFSEKFQGLNESYVFLSGPSSRSLAN